MLAAWIAETRGPTSTALVTSPRVKDHPVKGCLANARSVIVIGGMHESALSSNSDVVSKSECELLCTDGCGGTVVPWRDPAEAVTSHSRASCCPHLSTSRCHSFNIYSDKGDDERAVRFEVIDDLEFQVVDDESSNVSLADATTQADALYSVFAKLLTACRVHVSMQCQFGLIDVETQCDFEPDCALANHAGTVF